MSLKYGLLDILKTQLYETLSQSAGVSAETVARWIQTWFAKQSVADGRGQYKHSWALDDPEKRLEFCAHVRKRTKQKISRLTPEVDVNEITRWVNTWVRLS